jgi:hypothetical protein
MRMRLTDVPRVLSARTGQPAPDNAYARLWRACVSGRLPAERQGVGWRLEDTDLDAAATILGMTAAEPAEAVA